MRRIICSSFIFLMALNSQAQQARLGTAAVAETNAYQPIVQTEDENYLYTVDYVAPDLLLGIYDKKSLKSKKSLFVPIPELKKVYENVEKISVVGNDLVLFMSFDYYREDRYKLVAYVIDQERGKVKETIEIMDKPYDRSREKGFYDVNFSADRQKVVVNTATYYDDRDITEQVIVLLDAQFKEEAKREYSFNGNNIGVSTNMRVDNEGTVFFLSDGDLVMLDPFNDFEEWRETLPTDQLATNGALPSLQMDLNSQGNIIVTSFYRTTDAEDQDDANLSRQDRKEGDTQIDGVQFFSFDPLNQELVASKLTLFDKEIKDVFRWDDDKHDGHDGEINRDFSMMYLEFDNYGNSYLIGQPFYIERSYDDRGNLVGEYYNYLDLMVIGFDADGNVKWNERLPMLQQYYWANRLLGFIATSRGLSWFQRPERVEYYFDFNSYIINDELILVYNDLPINRAGKMQDQELEEYDKIKKGVPVIQQFNLETGQRTGRLLPKMTQPKKYLKPNLMYWSDMDQQFYYFLCFKKLEQLNSLSL